MKQFPLFRNTGFSPGTGKKRWNDLVRWTCVFQNKRRQDKRPEFYGTIFLI
jgi:hypothetical protein